MAWAFGGPVEGDWTENWVGIIPAYDHPKNYIGKKVIVPDGFLSMDEHKEQRNGKKFFPFTGYLHGVINESGGTRLSDDSWVFSMCDLLISTPERVIEKRTITSHTKIWVYQGELEFPEMYRRYPEESRKYVNTGLHLTQAELAALHWHARAFLYWQEEKVFARFAQYPHATNDYDEDLERSRY